MTPCRAIPQSLFWAIPGVMFPLPLAFFKASSCSESVECLSGVETPSLRCLFCEEGRGGESKEGGYSFVGASFVIWLQSGKFSIDCPIISPGYRTYDLAASSRIPEDDLNSGGMPCVIRQVRIRAMVMPMGCRVGVAATCTHFPGSECSVGRSFCRFSMSRDVRVSVWACERPSACSGEYKTLV